MERNLLSINFAFNAENNIMIMNYTEINKPQSKPVKWLILLGVVIILSVALCYQIILTRNLSQELANTRKVYIYDLQETLRGLRVDELNAEFEAKVNILNHEVLTAQSKISSLKEANVQADFSDVYLNSLKNKRDDMIKEYNDTLQNITNQINENLAQIAQEKKTATIFNKQSISAFTPDVIDVTPEIIERIQANDINSMLR